MRTNNHGYYPSNTNSDDDVRVVDKSPNPGKIIVGVAGCVVAIALICGLIGKFVHANNIQNLQIIQGFRGDVSVRRDGGWYWKALPRIWSYPKASLEICSAKDHDAIQMQFSNKSTAYLNCQIGYRIDSTNDNTIIRLHQFAEGDDEKIWYKVHTKLQTVAQIVASQYTPSESVEKFPEFAKHIHDMIVDEPELLSEGIQVTFFDCAGLPEYDNETQQQFAKQKEADLQKRLAEAEKLKLEAEKVRTEAQYQKEIAEFKGKADAETAKQVTEAERQAKLANIEAQKKVDVEKLEKEQLLVKAEKESEVAKINAEKEKAVAKIAVEKEKEIATVEAEKEKAVAEIAKATEAENLERTKLIAEQTIAKAKAEKEAIALAGKITEQERVNLEIEKETRIGVAKAYAEGIGKLKLPAVMNFGGGNGNPSDSLKTLIDLKNAEVAKGLIEEIPAKK